MMASQPVASELLVFYDTMTCSTKDFAEELINLGFEGLFKPMITIQLKLYCAGPLVARMRTVGH